jgi:CHAT domain-containing protein
MARKIVALAAVASCTLLAALAMAAARDTDKNLPASGNACDLDLRGGPETFRARLQAGWALHLAVDQKGTDVTIEARRQGGKKLLLVDLPMGSYFREELLLAAEEAMDLVVAFDTLGDRSGSPRLEVLFAGPASIEQLRAAADFSTLQRAEQAQPQVKPRIHRWLASRASDRWIRIAAASQLASLRRSEDPAAALRALASALGELKAGEGAMRSQLLALRGQILDKLDLKAEAEATLREALAAASEAGDPGAAGLAESGLARIAWDRNDSEKAIRFYTAARDHFGQAGYPELESDQELYLARSLMRLGSSPEPLARLLRLLATEPAPEGTRNRKYAELLREIGWWRWLEERSLDALPLLARAAELDPQSQPNLMRLAQVQLELGQAAAARATLAQAEPLSLELDQRAYLEAGICQADLADGLLTEARRRCLSARDELERAERLGALPGIDLSLARIEEKLARPLEAERFASRSCAAIEAHRGQAKSDRHRLDFMEVRTESLELLVELRMALHVLLPGAGWDRAGLEAAEKTRARLLHDLLATGYSPGPQAPGEADQRRRADLLLAELSSRSAHLTVDLARHGKLDPQATADLGPALRELDELRKSQRWLAPPEPADFELNAAQRELDPGTVMLVYHLGPEEAYGWALTRSEVRGTSLGQAETTRGLAAALAHQMSGTAPPSAATVEAWSARLAGLLLEPFAPELQAARQLVIVAPAELQQVAFAALPFPAASQRPLIASHTLVHLPSATVLPALRRRAAPSRPAAKLLAIVDDPVYDGDFRLPVAARKPGPFLRLPDTAAEGEDLLGLAGAGQAFRLTSFAANRQALLDGALADFRILHFATHARTGEAPRGLVLSRFDAAGRPLDDTFGFAELAALRFPADLAVTSACSSALGKKVAGEGLLGLSQGFLAAGIPRLVLTLWPIRGEPGRRLVGGFYRRLFAGASPAESLRLTQLEMIAEGRPPRDWAAFALYGDWRPPAEPLRRPPAQLAAESALDCRLRSTCGR